MKRLLAPGLNAVVTNWRPFVAIQLACVLLVAAYYAVQPMQSACAVLARWKAEGGLAFSALSMAIAAVVIPETARRLTKVSRDKPLTLADVCFQFGYFALLGVAIDLLYRGLGILLGPNPTPSVVAAKLCCDMFGFSGLFSMPLAVILFAWRDAGFSTSRGLALMKNGGFWERYFPLLLTCWAFWFPVMACLYSLPVNLQFVFAVLAEAAWCLLLVTAASRAPDEEKTIA